MRLALVWIDSDIIMYHHKISYNPITFGFKWEFSLTIRENLV